jgi:hypothetical protein
MENKDNQLALLHIALRDVLLADDVLNSDGEPSVPELLEAAGSYIEYRKHHKISHSVNWPFKRGA